MEKNIPVLTVHDCFKVPYQFASSLNDAIIHAYSKFIEEDHLAKDFKNTYFWTVFEQAYINNTELDTLSFTCDMLHIETMVKP
jgi:hypothetical protein